MVHLGLVGGESFFKNMLSEIMSNNDIVDNRYNLTRKGNRIVFNGNGFRFSEVTEVIDDSQLKEYYDQLSNIFNNDFEEIVMYSDLSAKLLVIANGKVIHVNSDNVCDDWIFEKIYGKGPNLRKTK